ncbi:MAG: Retaining alpha-galactosidase [Bacteroidetes bacterium]|jgi:alpha-glucosidase|nr:Retaining alpha-galactosidase [Bacteroidota bacterium]
MKKKKLLLRNALMLTFLLSSFFTLPADGSSDPYSLNSPDGSIQVRVKTTDLIYYSVSVDGNDIVWYSPVSMTTSQGTLGDNPIVIKSETNTVNESIKTVWGIRNEVENFYNQLTLTFDKGFSLVFRAYNDGIAYRFITHLKGELIVYDEKSEYHFMDDFEMVNHSVESYENPYERLYTRQKITEVAFGELITLPSIMDTGDINLAIVESDVYEYPGMYLAKRTNHQWSQISANFPRYPSKTEVGGSRFFNVIVKDRADFIAKTTGNRQFPWRAMVIARTDIELLNSDMVYKLARPEQIQTSWIKPGKVAWDWWNALNLQGVDFEAGINNETYEYFIDFASANNIPYVILDEGWSDQFDLMLPSSSIDMERLTAYAKEKNVKLILWAVWHAIDRQKAEVFEQFQKWGIAGVKVDFIERDDQLAIEFYENFAKEAAKYHLLVVYHGCSKPTGLSRAFPNIINYEAVRGNEYNKFSETVPTPGHNVDIAYTRMVAGPLDYTPGAMENAVEGDFCSRFENPMSQGTRAHQIGMFIVYYAPLQMLCDAPTQYEKYPDVLNFLSGIPTTWDQTVPLDGKLGEYVVVARKKGNDWYIGGLTNWTEREISINLSEFTQGNYTAEIIKDGINANRMAEDYAYEKIEVSSNENIRITMKKGGGFAIVLKKK